MSDTNDGRPPEDVYRLRVYPMDMQVHATPESLAHVAEITQHTPDSLERRLYDPSPRGYAKDQSHIEPMEHAHDAEQKRLAHVAMAAVWRFAEAIEDVSASGIEGLEVVLPRHLYQAIAQDLPTIPGGAEILNIGMAGGIVKIRGAG